jgi:poly [ADP-ribose] polymerase
MVSAAANSNKYYRLELDDSGRLAKTYGRVGTDGVTNYENSGHAGFDKTLREKIRKGYKEVEVAEDTGSARGTARVDNVRLNAVAQKALAGAVDPAVTDLIDRIVAANAHDIQIASGGLIKVDTSGRVRTALGVVTRGSIAKATSILDRLENATGTEFTRLLEEYLTYIPQKVGRNRGWDQEFLDGPAAFQKQRTFLDQLRDSVNFYESQTAAGQQDDNGDEIDTANLFKYKLTAVAADSDKFRDVVRFYEKSKNDAHGSSRLKVKRVFELHDQAGETTYKDVLGRIGNEKRMWHGTKAANMLSILRTGLYVPPTRGTSIQIVGRMFGDGIYLSEQSTKSLNYATGMWHGGRETSTFMLLADVAMGSEYRPNQHGHSAWSPRIQTEARTTKNKFGKPWNSINVQPGTAGVRNHEAIVWEVEQIRLRYVVEFA